MSEPKPSIVDGENIILGDNISQVAHSCREFFREIQEASELKEHVINRVSRLVRRSTAHQSLPLTQDDLIDDYEQYRVWARNLGVFAPDQASLDYRLREAQDVKDGIMGLLKGLRTDLEGILYISYQDREVPIPQDDDSSENTDSGSDESDLQDSLGRSAYEYQARLRRIAETINKLMQLAEVIRASNPGTRMTRAATFVKWEDGINTTEQFEQKYLPLLLEQRYKIKGSLIDRLVKAISLRRRRFKYQLKHQQRLAYPGDHEFSSSKANSSSNQHRTVPLRMQQDRQISNSASLSSIKVSESNVLTIATTFKKLRVRSTAPSTIVSASNKSTAENIDFPPPPPRIPARFTHFQCPYCCILLPERKFLAGKGTFSSLLWARHVLADLQPYICLEDECRTPHIILESQEDWLNHQKWEHAMEWWCEGDDVGHQPLSFDTIDQYVDHVRSVHNEHHEAANKHASTAGRPSLFPFSACPFCDFDPTISKTTRKKLGNDEFSQSLDAQSNLQKHIADELLNLFLIALPERDDIQDIETDTQRPAARGSTIRALDDISLVFSDIYEQDDRLATMNSIMGDRFPLEFAPSVDPYEDKIEGSPVDSWEDVWTSPQLQECVRSTYPGFEHDEKIKEMLAAKDNDQGYQQQIQLWIPRLTVGEEIIVEGRSLPEGVTNYYDSEAEQSHSSSTQIPHSIGSDASALSQVQEAEYTVDGKTNYANFFKPNLRRSPDDDNFID